MITGVPWYIYNKTIPKFKKIKYVEGQIKISVVEHENKLQQPLSP